MKKSMRFVALVAAIALMFSMTSSVFATSEAKGGELDGYVIFLHTNDSHGRIMEDGSSIGMAGVAFLKNVYESAGASVIVLDAGDTIHGLPIVTASKGESVVDVMNQIGYIAMAPGNHDFNYGYEHLLGLADDKMDFPVLAANVTYEADGSLVFEDNIIVTVDGIDIGIFGMATPETVTKTNPNNVIGIDFNEDELPEIAQAQVDTLRAEGCEVVIMLGHLGDDASSEPYRSTDILAEVTDIDFVIDGHSHSAYDEENLVNGTLVCSAGEYTESIGVIAYHDGAVEEAGLVHYDDLCADTGEVDEEGNPIMEFVGTDSVITPLVQSYYDEMMAIYAEVIGHTDVFLNGTRQYVRTQETNLGDLAADAILAAAPGADFALTNGGGIRADIQIGDITRYDLFTVFPFGNMVATVELTGEQLIYILEAATHACPNADGAFPQVSGLTFEIHTYKAYEGEYANPTNPGSRIQNVRINGELVDPEATYTMATNDFLAAGGDTYAILADNYLEGGILIGVNLEDALINFMQGIEDNCASYAEPAGRINIIAEEPEEEGPPKTGTASLAFIGIVAIVSGSGIMFFRKKD